MMLRARFMRWCHCLIWAVWDHYGLLWGVLYGFFWPFWMGYRLADWLLRGGA